MIGSIKNWALQAKTTSNQLGELHVTFPTNIYIAHFLLVQFHNSTSEYLLPLLILTIQFGIYVGYLKHTHPSNNISILTNSINSTTNSKRETSNKSSDFHHRWSHKLSETFLEGWPTCTLLGVKISFPGHFVLGPYCPHFLKTDYWINCFKIQLKVFCDIGLKPWSVGLKSSTRSADYTLITHNT